MTAGYGWWYGTYTATPPSSRHARCSKIRSSRLTLQRLPRPRRPSPRRFLPEARGRACCSAWPEISDIPSRTNIPYVLRRQRCIEGCWSRDQMYHRWGGSPESKPSRNQPSQHTSSTHLSMPTTYIILLTFLRHCNILPECQTRAMHQLLHACAVSNVLIDI